MQSGGDGLPWIDRVRFAELMFEWELRSYRDARAAGWAGHLRSRPARTRSAISGSKAWRRRPGWKRKRGASATTSRVFIAPPWKEIYGKDEERRQSWDVAVRTYEMMAETYAELGYELVELPRTSVEQRADFVIAEMSIEVPGQDIRRPTTKRPERTPAFCISSICRAYSAAAGPATSSPGFSVASVKQQRDCRAGRDACHHRQRLAVGEDARHRHRDDAGDHVQRSHQRRRGAGDLAMLLHGKHGGRRYDEAEQPVADEQR